MNTHPMHTVAYARKANQILTKELAASLLALASDPREYSEDTFIQLERLYTMLAWSLNKLEEYLTEGDDDRKMILSERVWEEHNEARNYIKEQCSQEDEF